jgi:hypothetical protein
VSQASFVWCSSVSQETLRTSEILFATESGFWESESPASVPPIIESPTMKRLSCGLLTLSFLFAYSAYGFTAGQLAKVDVGDYAPSYASTKCGGADDGVAEGKTVCYTCRAGNAPVFYLFIRDQQPSQGVLRLMKEINSLVGSKKKDKVTGVINFLGDPKNETTRKNLKKLAEQHQLTQVAVTVTGDGDKFDLNGKDEVTLIMYEEGIIRLRVSAQPAELDKEGTEIVLRRSKALIK